MLNALSELIRLQKLSKLSNSDLNFNHMKLYKNQKLDKYYWFNA
ncbi:10272_t:CDS:1, partial [Racocetra persica]